MGTRSSGPSRLEVLTAAGGFCAPLTPFYALPQFATRKRPVREAFPSYQADRGRRHGSERAVHDRRHQTAITVIKADADALGGTFATTKSVEDFECPPFTDVAVGIVSHCREYQGT